MVENYELEMQKLYREIINAKSEDKKPTLPVVCPTTFLRPCRLCDLAKTILFRKDNKDTPIRKQASELNRKKAYYSNVILPTNPSEVVVFQYGDSIWQELMTYQMSPTSEIKDFLDPKVGRNIIITKKVGAEKRQTKYSVKARINPSPLLDMKVLSRLADEQYQLQNILDLLKLGKVKPLYQSALQEGENELRFLPSWLGPGITKFFQLVMFHYGVTEDEFELIQKGEYNPFAGGMDVKEEPIVKVYPKAEPFKPVEASKASPWDEYFVTAPASVLIPKKEEAKDAQKGDVAYPVCFGKKHDPNDPECMDDCAKDGWEAACKTATEALSRSNIEQRRTAKRLVK